MKLSAKHFGCCSFFSIHSSRIYSKGVAAADKKFDNYSYVDAIATYEKVAAKGYKDEKCSKTRRPYS
jgi:hypothetical protein